MHVRTYHMLKALASIFRLRENLESRSHVRGALLEPWSSTQSSSNSEPMMSLKWKLKSDNSYAGIKTCAKMSMTQRSLQGVAYDSFEIRLHNQSAPAVGLRLQMAKLRGIERTSVIGVSTTRSLLRRFPNLERLRYTVHRVP